MSHAKDILIIGACLNGDGQKIGNAIADTQGRRIADSMGSDFQGEEDDIRILRLIVCWNNCAGLANPMVVPELLAIVQALREIDTGRSYSILAKELTDLHKRAVALLGEPEWKTEGGAA
jgi:hypothetical protein